MCYVSSGSGFDTVVYLSATTLPAFSSRQVVNQTNNSIELAPAVMGFRNGSGFSGGVLYGGVGNSNVYYDGSSVVVGIQPISNTIPEIYKLSQNYPNPFNPNTSIEFSLPKDNFVTLKIYDILGKEIAALVNNDIKAGIYKIDFDASNLSSGIYIYQLSAGDFRDVKKMVLIK